MILVNKVCNQFPFQLGISRDVFENEIFILIIVDCRYFALPAKEELNPMFPSKSSSDINSKTNAFKNNFKVKSQLYYFLNNGFLIIKN